MTISKKILKNNIEYEIVATLNIEHSREKFEYILSFNQREKGKKKWIKLIDEDNYSYRRLSLEDRAAFRMESIKKIFTDNELLEFAEMVHKKITPSINDLYIR